ncbi:MAG: glycosyltransferase family 4 protein [Candidatus Riflebacteria bacterium]|nr:glycosyltransferase family 4 protein [Candidatus Riflebacteria bacterium]
MKIGITTFGCDSGKSGIGRYLIELLNELANLKTEHTFEILVYNSEKEIFIPQNSGFKALTFPESIRSPLVNNIWHQIFPPLIAARRNFDVLFLPAGNRRLVFRAPCPVVATVHDFSSLHVPQKYDKARIFYIKKVLPMLMRQMTSIITVSESSKRDIVEYARVPDEKTTIIHHGVDHRRFFPGNRDKAALRLAEKFKIEKPFIFYISRIEHPGKNHIRLIQAFEILKREKHIPHDLILAGSDWDRASEVHQCADNSDFKSAIRFAGHISTDDLPDFYRCSDVFAFPSLYEGFGMPILEAMACGAPTACSDVSSLPEVAGEAAVLFNPMEPSSIADSLYKIISNHELRSNLVQSGIKRAVGMTWKKSAERTLEVLLKTKYLWKMKR